jgi:hypothetical protein
MAAVLRGFSPKSRHCRDQRGACDGEAFATQKRSDPLGHFLHERSLVM